MCDIKKEDRSFSESEEICSDEAVSQSESVNQDTTTIAFDAKDRPRAIIADRGYAVLSLGDSYYLSTTVKPSGASKALLYKSLDPSVVEVDCMGKIIAKNPGNTIVRVKSGEYPDIYTDITVYVNETEDYYYDELVPAIYVEKMELSCDTTTLLVGDLGSVSVMIMPKDVTDKTVSFESSNTSVLICDPYTGKFVAKAPGKAKIIATASNNEKNISILQYFQDQKR